MGDTELTVGRPCSGKHVIKVMGTQSNVMDTVKEKSSENLHRK